MLLHVKYDSDARCADTWQPSDEVDRRREASTHPKPLCYLRSTPAGNVLLTLTRLTWSASLVVASAQCTSGQPLATDAGRWPHRMVSPTFGCPIVIQVAKLNSTTNKTK